MGLYDRVNTEPQKQRSSKLPVIVVIVAAVIIAGVILIIRPMVQHRKYIQYMGNLSTDTKFAAGKVRGVLHKGEEELPVTSDELYELYARLVYSEKADPKNKAPKEPAPVWIDYENGDYLYIWPYHYEDRLNDGIFVLYKNVYDGEYMYATYQVQYRNIEAVFNTN